MLKTILEKLIRFYSEKILDVKGFYNKSARFYDLVHHFQTLYADNIHRNAVAESAEFEDGDLVLDVGTGTSLAAICAINLSYPAKKIRIIGVDLSKQMLKVARKNMRRFGIKNQVFNVNCDARSLPFRPSLFSKIISVYGLGGVKTGLKKLFLELLGVSKEAAIFSLGEMTAPPREKSLFRRKVHELLMEPFINLVWQFKDLHLSTLFHMFHVREIKKKYFDTHYLGSMTLLVGKLNSK